MEYKQIAILNNTPRSVPESRLPGQIQPLTGAPPVPAAKPLPLTNRLWTLIGARCLTNGAQWSSIGLFYLYLNGAAAGESGMVINPQLHNWYNELYININVKGAGTGAQRQAINITDKAGTVHTAADPGREAQSKAARSRRAGQKAQTAEAAPDIRCGTVRPLAGIEAQVIQMLHPEAGRAGTAAAPPEEKSRDYTYPGTGETKQGRGTRRKSASDKDIPLRTEDGSGEPETAAGRAKAARAGTAEKPGGTQAERQPEQYRKSTPDTRHGTILPLPSPSVLRSLLPGKVFSDLAAQPAQMYHKASMEITGEVPPQPAQQRDFTVLTPKQEASSGTPGFIGTAQKHGRRKTGRAVEILQPAHTAEPGTAEQAGKSLGTIRPAVILPGTPQEQDTQLIDKLPAPHAREQIQGITETIAAPETQRVTQAAAKAKSKKQAAADEKAKERSIAERLAKAESKAHTAKDTEAARGLTSERGGSQPQSAQPYGTIRPVTAQPYDFAEQTMLRTDAAENIPSMSGRRGINADGSVPGKTSSKISIISVADKNKPGSKAELAHLKPAAFDKSRLDNRGRQSTDTEALTTEKLPSVLRPSPVTGVMQGAIKAPSGIQTVTDTSVAPLSLIHPQTDNRAVKGRVRVKSINPAAKRAAAVLPVYSGIEDSPAPPAGENVFYNQPAFETPLVSAPADGGIPPAGEPLYYQDPAMRERVIIQNRKVPQYISSRQMLSVPALSTRRDSDSLFYRDTETDYQTGSGAGTNTADTANIGRAVQTALSNARPAEHKTETNVRKVDMTVKKPQLQAAGDPLSDPVQLSRLVNKVYEQLERKIIHERRRVGL